MFLIFSIALIAETICFLDIFLYISAFKLPSIKNRSKYYLKYCPNIYFLLILSIKF